MTDRATPSDALTLAVDMLDAYGIRSERLLSTELPSSVLDRLLILKNTIADRVIEPRHTLQNPWDAPFFYEDSRHVFYVTTTSRSCRFLEWNRLSASCRIGQHASTDPAARVRAASRSCRTDRPDHRRTWGRRLDPCPDRSDLSPRTPTSTRPSRTTRHGPLRRQGDWPGGRVRSADAGRDRAERRDHDEPCDSRSDSTTSNDATCAGAASVIDCAQDTEFTYTFENFFHPFVGELIEQLNTEVAGRPARRRTFHAGPGKTEFFDELLHGLYEPEQRWSKSKHFPKEIDVSEGGPYANYNWELLFHIPLTIAVHLSKNQRFAEAQRWFHYIFDPTSNDTSVPTPQRFWKFLRFRQGSDVTQIDELLALLSKPD